ncbi:LURP-one-related/scramblase family protein [Lacrimispora sp.]|uniref:LURP-one-related/scramblase family protein n=1 Tax=Lacrimispora sp. TaxID=2719234 RepID=UPI003994BCF5
MKLLFRQRFFSWFDSYDIYDESGATVYTVSGKLAWGHKLEIYDRYGNHVATLREQVFSFLPQFAIQMNGETIGTITKKFTFFKPSFTVDCKDWHVEGNFWEWDYQILNSGGSVVATIEKQLFNFTDTYLIDVYEETDSLLALMVVLAIDAVKCSDNS